jgi:hypothetical protein
MYNAGVVCSCNFQDCQMVCFQTKNPNLGKFCRVLLWKILVYFMTIWSILRPLEIIYCHLVYFVVIWYIFSRFVILDQEKSGNPGAFKSHRIGYRGKFPTTTLWMKFWTFHLVLLQTFLARIVIDDDYVITYRTFYPRCDLTHIL